ncbi:hypothetical protein H7198_06660 [Fructobacillus sp. CRL 2054]|uniref:mucin-binding protein n=1 Tax=Fructobacillus sp. CRL 2054 TaxID=2763007 RepID=UPI0023782B3A|nr:hypothetical protein [Fructobacillus sp. CRL 2054]MDD9139269.1 hypothetical protein [Fructobacillus sp. CRL 2054]
MLKNLIQQNNVVNHKYLHKVKKNWVIVSAMTIALLGGATTVLSEHPVNAVTTQTATTSQNDASKPDPEGTYTLTPGTYFYNFEIPSGPQYLFGESSGITFPSKYLNRMDMETEVNRTIHLRDIDDINNPNAKDIDTVTQSSGILVRWVTFNFKTNTITNWGQFGHESNDRSGRTDGDTYRFPEQNLTNTNWANLSNYESTPVDQNGQPISSIADSGDLNTKTVTKAVNYGPNPDKTTTPNQDIYVYYKHASNPVTESKTVTRTINLVDADNNNSSLGSTTQTVKYTRTNTTDAVTGKVTSYGNWTAENNKTGFDAYTAPDKSADGYVNPTDPNVAAQTVDPDTAKDGDTSTVTRQYHHKKTNVTAKTDGISQDAKNQLTRSLSRTIHFVDSKGKVIKDSINQTATFNGTAEYDWVTKTLVNSNDITWDNGDKTNAPYTAPSSVEKDGVTYTNPSDASAINLNVNTNPTDETIVYKGSQTPVTPKNPQGHMDDIRKTVTRTIHFVDQNGHKIQDDKVESVTFERTGYLDENGNFVATSNWSADGNDTFDKVNDSIDGYTVKDDSQNKTVKANETDQSSEITISYEKNSAPAPTPTPSNNGGNKGNGGNAANGTNNGTHNNANNAFATPAARMLIKWTDFMHRPLYNYPKTKKEIST